MDLGREIWGGAARAESACFAPIACVFAPKAHVSVRKAHVCALKGCVCPSLSAEYMCANYIDALQFTH